MRIAEPTRQQLDPAATFGAYRSTIVLSLLAIVLAVGMTLGTLDPAAHPVVMLTSLLVLVIAALWLLRAATPLRAPFRRSSMILVYGLVVVAVVLSTIASLGSNHLISDDWGPIAIAVFTIAMTPYRPARDMFIGLGIISVLVGVVSLVKVSDLIGEGPGLAFVVVGLTPTLAVSLAAIQYSRYLVVGVQSWHRRADVGAASLANDLVDGIASTVERDRLKILSRDVSPFFAELIERGTIGDDDRARARSIAESMRSIMVADANRTWLGLAFEHTRRGDDFLSVDDPSFLAGWMIPRQRTALRALLVAIIEDERLGRVWVSIRPEGAVACVSLHLMAAPSAPAAASTDYDTYFSVLRVVFAAFHVDVDDKTVIVRFEYDCS